MINESNFMASLPNDEIRVAMVKILDKIKKSDRHQKQTVTDFIDPYQARLTQALSRQYGLGYQLQGGFSEAERNRLVIGPTSVQNQDPVAIILGFETKFHSFSHRDVLGALMAMGIKREKIGDIRVAEKKAQFVVATEMGDYICTHFNRIKQESMVCSKIETGEEICAVLQKRNYVKTVASMRLDALISAAYGLSREKSQKAISQGLIKLNHRPTNKFETVTEEVILLSLRGRGRVSATYQQGKSKKGRNIILFEEWLD